MDANCFQAKRPIKVYEVIILLGETPISVICADVRGDDDGFLVCDPCPELSPCFVDTRSVNPQSKRITRKTWINKRQIHSVEELGEINE